MSLRRLRQRWDTSGARLWTAVLACLLVGHPLLHDAWHAAEAGPELDCHRVNTHLDAGHKAHDDDCDLCRQLGADGQRGTSATVATPTSPTPLIAEASDAPRPWLHRSQAPRGPPVG